MRSTLTGISSMATRQMLAEMSAAFHQSTGEAVSFVAVGGVDAVRRVQAGEAFDLVILASDAIERLIAQGHLVAGSVRPVARSTMAVGVPADRPPTDISTPAALREVLLSAKHIGYSTGPSGAALLQLLQDWGLADTLGARLIQARPGVPVAQLLANGDADLGFQQLSELQGHAGVRVLGPMPLEAEITTTFVGAIGARSANPGVAQSCLNFLCLPQNTAIKQRCGLEPA